MPERLTLPLFNAQQGHQALIQAWTECVKPMLMAGHRLVLEVKPENRSDAQNRRLWAMLTDVSKQVDLYGQKMTPEDWKTMFTAALKRSCGLLNRLMRRLTMASNGCHNREPFAPLMNVQYGWTQGGSHRIAYMVDVPFRMNPECQYTLTDLGNCKHRKA